MENIKILENLEEIKLIDEQRASIDALRPFSKGLENKIFQKLKLDWNYNSNAIEGNQLSYDETVAFLNLGLTAKGKPFKDYLDIRGHDEAIEFMLQLIKENRSLSETYIKHLHRIILVAPYFSKIFSPEGIESQKEIKIGEYKMLPNHIKTASGDIHYYTNPEDVPLEMNNLLEWYRNAEEENLHPVVLSAVFHHKFTSIHPFDDGNGRLARVLSNFILMNNHYPIIVIKYRDKDQYYEALNIAENGVYGKLVKLFAENIKFSFDIIQKSIKGENINEAEGLDKEIDLFIKDIQAQNIQKVDFDKQKDFLINAYVKTFFDYLLPKLDKIGGLFRNFYISINNNKNISNNFKLNIDKISQIEKSIIRCKLTFSKALIGDYSVIFHIRIAFENKAIDFSVFHHWDSKPKFSEKISYSESPQLACEEFAKDIINYVMNEIKDHSNKKN